VTSAAGRAVRECRLTPSGRKRLDAERNEYRRVSGVIASLLDET
jgi:hypothetical protein